MQMEKAPFWGAFPYLMEGLGLLMLSALSN